MIWLTWRQARVQALAAAGALAAFAILLAVTGPHLASRVRGQRDHRLPRRRLRERGQRLPQRAGRHQDVPGCIRTWPGARPRCARDHRHLLGRPADRPRARDRNLPAGLEPERLPGPVAGGQARADRPGGHGRHRGAQPDVCLVGRARQQCPRSRRRHFGVPRGRFSWWVFSTHGITPLGYAAFGFALGAATGVLIRRALPAMAITLAIFAAAQVAMPLWVRPYLIPPVRTIATFEAVQATSLGTVAATVVPGQPGSWIITSGPVNAAGQPVAGVPVSCLPPPPGAGLPAKPASAEAVWQCMDRQGYRDALTYQPGSRYWPLQLIETGVFLALALALAGLSFWRLGRRPS